MTEFRSRQHKLTRDKTILAVGRIANYRCDVSGGKSPECLVRYHVTMGEHC